MANDDVKIKLTAEDRTKVAFASVKKSITSMKGEALTLNGVFSAMLPALTVGGLAAFAKRGIDAADAMNDLSARTGVSVETLSGLQLVAAQSDTSIDALGKGINKLSIFMAENADEARKMGLTAKDPAEAFVQLAGVLEKTASVQDRNAIANKVLGKSYMDLMPALSGGSEALREQIRLGQEAAGVTTAQALAADEFNDELDRMKVLLTGVSINVGSAFIPVLKGAIYFAKNLGISFGAAGDKIAAFWNLLKTRDITAYQAEVKRINALLHEMRDEVKADLSPGSPVKVKPGGDLTADGLKTKTKTGGASKAAAAAKAAAEAELALRATTIEQAARLEQDDIDRQIAGNKAAFDAKQIDAADYYAALTDLQRQQADSEIAALQAQRAAAAAVKGSDADKLKAKADIVRLDTEIELIERRTADQAVANAASKQAVANALKLKQDEYLDGLEQEAFLAGLSNDERETALLLLEAEKLGITDINRLLELQGAIRKGIKDQAAAEDFKKQQDDLYRNVQEGVQRAFADGLNAIAAGEGGFRGALQNIVDTIRSAMSNALAASLTEGFMGMLGGKEGVLGMAGKLGLGGKKDGSTPASALYVSDVAAGGALGAAGGDQAGGLFSGIGDMISTLMASLKSGLASLVSGLGNVLGSLFGNAGGGQNWIGAIASMFGYADGGYTGPGGKHQPAGVVHAGEYVFSADSVRRLGLGALDNLHRIARGGMIPRGPRTSYADGGLVNLPAQSGAPGSSTNIRIVNSIDPEMAGEFFNSPSGERVFFNLISRNSSMVRQLLA